MPDKIYRVKVAYTFTGYFDIKAEDKEQAIVYTSQHCGMTIGNIDTQLNPNNVDWEFDVHPTETKIKSVRKAVTPLIKE